MEMRYVFLKDYLERFPEKPPEMLILESDKYLFQTVGYPTNTYKSILGYYHKGMYREYFRKKGLDEDGVFPFLAFVLCKVYSLNNDFHYLGGMLFDKFIGKFLSLATSVIELEKVYAREPVITYSSDDEKKISEWKKLYKKFDNKIEPKAKLFFDKSIDLAQKFNIKIILLDTPNFDFGDDASYSNVRDVYTSRQNKNLKYLRLSPEVYEKNLEYLFDASHLNPTGRQKYTEELVVKMKEIKW